MPTGGLIYEGKLSHRLNVAFPQVYTQTKRSVPMLFVRGDGVVLVSPAARGGPKETADFGASKNKS